MTQKVTNINILSNTLKGQKLLFIRWSPCALFLLIHSTIMKNDMIYNSPNGMFVMGLIIDFEQIVDKNSMAWVMFSALKNTQATTVKLKVNSIKANSFKEGRILPSATVFKFFLFLLVKRNGRK